MNIETVKVQSQSQIEEIIKYCSDCFYNQELNNEKDIHELSVKFLKYAVFEEVRVDTNLAGFTAYYANNTQEKIAFISMIILKREYQGRGIGSFLIKNIISSCSKLGFIKLCLEVDNSNKTAIELYKKYNFRFVKEKSEKSSIYECML